MYQHHDSTENRDIYPLPSLNYKTSTEYIKINMFFCLERRFGKWVYFVVMIHDCVSVRKEIVRSSFKGFMCACGYVYSICHCGKENYLRKDGMCAL